jgi:GPH family glycoside/pentoside/hexuronide:cation symporter
MTEDKNTKRYIVNRTKLNQPLPWNTLIAFGFGGLIPIALFNVAGQLISLIGNIGLGLSAFWLGVILIIPRLWDAISDPLIGHISDNYRSRWGRRRPFILVGGIAVALSFVLMWWVPKGTFVQSLFPSEQAYTWFQLLFILTGLLIFYTSCTVFEIPHGALGMGMTKDSHERTKLFSAKSFLGNLFAMGTPWLFYLANLKIFKGTGGNEVDGMRYVSIMIAIVLIPMSIWWFFALKEANEEKISKQKKSKFWEEMKRTLSNKTFLKLVIIIFTLAMGFNFVGLFNYYISIYYLFGGDKVMAGSLLGISGTVWAITGLLAVIPLNIISKKIGKKHTLILAILLMSSAQLSKIFCYNPNLPYLVLIPTILLSAGMLMFFTLGASMVGDICDEDELHTGTRSEGSYYSVFWWFIKMGTAFASFVTGALLVTTDFDEKRIPKVDQISGKIEILSEEIASEIPASSNTRIELKNSIQNKTQELNEYLKKRQKEFPKDTEFLDNLRFDLNQALIKFNTISMETPFSDEQKKETLETLKELKKEVSALSKQSPKTLLILRIIEIGLPLILCIISIFLCFLYPLTEKRCHEIKLALERRD